MTPVLARTRLTPRTRWIAAPSSPRTMASSPRTSRPPALADRQGDAWAPGRGCTSPPPGPAPMPGLPETILQFGTGKFLRAFTDLFVHQANQQGQQVGQVLAVQSTGDDRVRLLNQQGGRYHILVRGLS